MQDSLKSIIDEYFRKEEELEKNNFDQLTLYIYSLESQTNSDLYMLAKLLKKEDLDKMVSYFDGDVIRLPSKEEYKSCVLTALCFYLKEIKQWTWPEIKQYLNLPDNYKDELSSISIGGKINKVKASLGKDLLKALYATEENDFKKFWLSLKDETAKRDYGF
ncbi:MAG: hypothetical protein BWY64_02839 [bacterium ADurb.Bin363]|nr:MAG: hypothetical protein BWY64_02839 [bacterium ADurb.Bin363]